MLSSPCQVCGAPLLFGKLSTPIGLGFGAETISKALRYASIVIAIDLYGSPVEGLMANVPAFYASSSSSACTADGLWIVCLVSVLFCSCSGSSRS